MNKINKILVGVITFGCLNGCGTFTPIPSHGGGKRFAVEQGLVAIVSRRAISDIPYDVIKNKKIMFDVSMVQDEGGGALNGGRSYASEILNLNNINQKFTGASSETRQYGVNAQRNDSTYTKDYTFNGSDAKQFSNLLMTSLIRQNVMLTPKENEGKADYYLEVIVDVLGTWRTRTDWLLSNNESLKAVISFEYVITPYNNEAKEQRRVGRISYEAEYLEKYAGWMGPYKTDVIVRESKLGGYITNFGQGSESYSNLVRVQPIEFDKTDSQNPVQINPMLR
jgi:hypothetical protein